MDITEFLKSEENQEKLEQEVIRLGTENPDFVYNTSSGYTSSSYTGPAFSGGEQSGPDCSGCLWGQSGTNLGVVWAGEQKAIDIYLPAPCERADSWRKCQKHQDHGGSWGEAIKFLKSS